MKPVSTHHQLLLQLSRQGDASAFCTLFEPFAIAAYQRLRATGLDHKDALRRLIPLLRKLYDRAYTLNHSLSIEFWIASQIGKKNGELFSTALQEPATQILLEDISRFASGLNLFISREFSAFRHKKRSGVKRRNLRILIHRQPVIRGALCVIITLILCGIAGSAAAGYLWKTGQSLVMECVWLNAVTQVTVKPPDITISKTSLQSERMLNSFSIGLNKNSVLEKVIVQDTVIRHEDPVAPEPLPKPPVVPAKTAKPIKPPAPLRPTVDSAPPPAVIIPATPAVNTDTTDSTAATAP